MWSVHWLWMPQKLCKVRSTWNRPALKISNFLRRISEIVLHAAVFLRKIKLLSSSEKFKQSSQKTSLLQSLACVQPSDSKIDDFYQRWIDFKRFISQSKNALFCYCFETMAGANGGGCKGRFHRSGDCRWKQSTSSWWVLLLIVSSEVPYRSSVSPHPFKINKTIPPL